MSDVRRILEIRDLSVTSAGATTPELDRFSLSLDAGACTIVLGETGSGKEALVRVLSGFSGPDDEVSGTIAVGAGSVPAKKWRENPRIAYLPGVQPQLFAPQARVLPQLVRLAARALDAPFGSACEELRLVLARYKDAPSLAALDTRPDGIDPVCLAWGVLALAVCRTPDLILADDPFGDLGPKAMVMLLKAMECERKRAGFALLYATGCLPPVLRLDGRIVVIRQGGIVEEGDRRRFESGHTHVYTRQLFQSLPVLRSDATVPRMPTRGQPLLQVHDVEPKRPHGLGLRWPRDEMDASVTRRRREGVTFELCRGGSVAFVGEQGSGRRAMVRALLFIDPPHKGRVVFDAVALQALSQPMLNRLRRRVAFVTGSDEILDPGMSIGEVVEEPLRTHLGLSGRLVAGYRDAALKRVGLSSLDSQVLIANLSAFDRRRLQIARAIAAAPLLVVIDEPLAGLDAFAQVILRELLTDLRRHLDAAMLVVTADFSLARALAGEVFVFDSGRVVEHGAMSEVLKFPKSPVARDLIAAVSLPSEDVSG